MSQKLFAFDLLRSQLLERVNEELDGQIEDAVGDSEIEKLFAVSLTMLVLAGPCEFTDVTFLDGRDVVREQAFLGAGFQTRLIVEPQAQLPDWRVDFLIHAYDFGDRIGHRQGWRRLIVECDGHDFHERTKKQAARDRARDRWAQKNDMKVFRFTGSELWGNPLGRAQEVVDWALEAW